MPSHKINDYLQHTLREDFTSPNPEVRKAAIYALGRLGSGEDVLVILRNIATQDDDPEVRYTAKKALNYWEGVLRDSGSEPEEPVKIAWPSGRVNTIALEDALTSPRPGRQIAAVIEAVRLGDGDAIGPILRLLEEERDPWVVSMGVKALGALGDDKQVADVARFLKHDNFRVVANAIEALEMLRDPQLARRVEPFLESEDNRVRANAVKALHPWDPDLAFGNLEAMARNHRPWMRASAIYCLKVLDDRRCLPLLEEMLNGEFSEDLVGDLCRALVAQGQRETVGLLGYLCQGAEDDRAKRIRAAYEELSKKLGVPLDEALGLIESARDATMADRPLRSGMFRVEDVADDEPAEAPRQRSRRDREPAPERKPQRRTGYGTRAMDLAEAQDDPGSNASILLALGLAILTAAYGAYRVFLDPPPVAGVSEPQVR